MKTDIMINSFDQDKELRITPYNNMIAISNSHLRLVIFPDSLREYVEIIDSLRHECEVVMKLLNRKGADSDFQTMTPFNLKIYRNGGE